MTATCWIARHNLSIAVAALLLTCPRLLGVPFYSDRSRRSGMICRSASLPVLIIDGEKDSRRSPGDGARLAERLTRAGATVTHHILPV